MPLTPIFLSRPTSLATQFEPEAERFDRFLNGFHLQPRRLGKGDYSTDAPLRAVINLMQECQGAIILGFPKQVIDFAGFGTISGSLLFPTPWNQIEGALAFCLDKPTLVVAHTGIDGGVFDYGVTGTFILRIDMSNSGWFQTPDFKGIFEDWRKRLPH